MDNAKKIKIGHTSITWPSADIETAVEVIARLGFHGIETFGRVLDVLEKEGKSDLFEKHNIPLVSSYFSLDINDPSKRDEAFASLELWSGLLKKHKTDIVVLGGNGVDRRSFKFLENKSYIVETVNEIGKRLQDKGINCCFHPHTGTPVETKDEIHSLMDAINPSCVFFAPDVGQIQKGGADPVEIVNTYLPLIKHVHLKDFVGKKVEFDSDGKEIDSTGFACYTPLGEGVVDLKRLMDIFESAPSYISVMIELDGRKLVPIPQEEALMISKRYMEKLGYTFHMFFSNM